MTVFVALLRAVNLGGASTLPMVELRAMCDAAGHRNVRTYIASGNVVFESGRSESAVKADLETRLADYAGKPVGVVIRTGAEMAAVRDANPFPDSPGNRAVAIFLDAEPPTDALTKAVGCKNEVMALGLREIYVAYDEGMGTSRLRIPAAKAGTARNMNTVTKLAAMAAER